MRNLPILLVVGAVGLQLQDALSQEQKLSIESPALVATFSSNRLSLTSAASQRAFLKEVRLSAEEGTARVTNVLSRQFGSGTAIEVSYPDGSRDRITLFRKLPFALFQTSRHNPGSDATVLRRIETLSGTIDLNQPAAGLKSFGTGGLLGLDNNPGSYAWQVVVEPQSRNGIVCGWLSHDRGSGVLFTKLQGAKPKIDARIDYGRLRIAPGQTEQLETLAVGYFEDARLGLEAWADAVALSYGIQLPAQPAGYCTWYSQPHGGASDEKHLAELSAFAAKHLAPYGFSVIQIDDKWQAGVSTNGPKRNFTTHQPTGPYPSGMKAAADQIKSLGLVPGIWFMPFAGTYYDPFFQSHQDWFVRQEDGRPYETAWGGTCLDMTHPGAREHLRGIVNRIAGEWGYQYFKLDGLWTGTGTKQQYVNSGYKEDGIGDAVLHNPDKTNIEAYRDGLRLVRETAGPKVFVLGCNGPQNMRSYGGAFGLVDAMRIGPDNRAEWKSLLRGPTFGSRHYFLHGRVWYNDPDPVYVRASMPLHHAQLICSWVTLSGQLNLSSEWLPGLPPERLDLLKRTFPAHGLMARPADLFERDPPSVWLLTDTRRSPRRDVLGLFNWNEQEQRFDYPLERLGFDSNLEYLAFDYWRNTSHQVKGRLQLTVPAQSCRVLSIYPRANHPQLISTSRHITQGIVDVTEEKWNPTARMLTGRSQVVADDPYELRFAITLAATHFEAWSEKDPAAIKTDFKQADQLLRATIKAPISGEIRWRVRFQ